MPLYVSYEYKAYFPPFCLCSVLAPSLSSELVSVQPLLISFSLLLGLFEFSDKTHSVCLLECQSRLFEAGCSQLAITETYERGCLGSFFLTELFGLPDILNSTHEENNKNMEKF